MLKMFTSSFDNNNNNNNNLLVKKHQIEGVVWALGLWNLKKW